MVFSSEHSTPTLKDSKLSISILKFKKILSFAISFLFYTFFIRDKFFYTCFSAPESKEKITT
jgi:hypothetical protein